MRKRSTMALAAGALVVTMIPGVATAAQPVGFTVRLVGDGCADVSVYGEEKTPRDAFRLVPDGCRVKGVQPIRSYGG